jgi:hypothetical protein
MYDSHKPSILVKGWQEQHVSIGAIPAAGKHASVDNIAAVEEKVVVLSH